MQAAKINRWLPVQLLVVGLAVFPVTRLRTGAAEILSLPKEIAVTARLRAAGHRSGLGTLEALALPIRLTGVRDPEWIVDHSRRPDGRLCGTGGCPLQVWSRVDSGPYALVFDRQVLAYRIDRSTTGTPVLEVDLHGVLCGGTGADACRYRFAWRSARPGRDSRFEAVGRRGEITRYVGPLAQAIPVVAPPASPIASDLAGYAGSCASAGGVADLSNALVRLPDLDGDGRPEMLFDARYAICERLGQPVEPACRGDACATRLYVQRDGAWQTAWSGAPAGYDIEISDRGAAMSVRAADCDDDRKGRCAARALRWNAAAHRFTEAAEHAHADR